MHPYSTTARSRDRLSIVLCFTFAALTLAAFYVSTVTSDYRALTQSVGFLALVATVYVMARNRIPYIYAVEQEDDGETWDLVIARLKGKHRITMCRLAMRDIREIDVADKMTHPAIKKKYQNDTVHNYSPTLFPEKSLYLRFEDSNPYAAPSATEEQVLPTPGERIVIRIACDEVILAMLQQAMK